MVDNSIIKLLQLQIGNNYPMGCVDGSPVVLNNCDIIMSCSDGTKVIDMDIKNVYNKPIKNMHLNIQYVGLNEQNEKIIPNEYKIDIELENLNILPDRMIKINRNFDSSLVNLVSVDIHIIKIEYYDNFVLEGGEYSSFPIMLCKYIDPKDDLYDTLVYTLLGEGIDVIPRYWYVKGSKGCWCCCCGNVVSDEYDKCPYCGIDKQFQEKYINREYLKSIKYGYSHIKNIDVKDKNESKKEKAIKKSTMQDDDEYSKAFKISCVLSAILIIIFLVYYIVK